MTNEKIQEFFTFVIEQAKVILQESGQVLPIAWVQSVNMNIGPELRRIMVDPTTHQRVKDSYLEGAPKEGILLGLPLLYEDPALLFEMINFLNEDKAGLGSFLVGEYIKKFPDRKDAIIPRLVQEFKNMTKLGDKDIVALFLRKVCEVSEAEFIIKVDEVWLSTLPASKEAPSIEEVIKQSKEMRPSQDPDRKECVMVTLETRTTKKLHNCVFYRESQDKDAPGFKSIKWGEEQVMEDGVNGQSLTGRFFNLMPKASPQETKPA